jgi:hypothetical protein
MANWIVPENCSEPLMCGLGKELERAESTSTGLFPNLRSDSEIAIACDYSGDHKGSAFQVLTFLLADRPGILREWEAERLSIRQRHLPDGRRMAFKNLSDAQRQRALGPFLSAAAGINGMLLCMAVEKTVGPCRLGDGFNHLQHIKPHTLEKLVNVAMYGAFLVGGLNAPGQNLTWITDDDEIVSNESTQDAACQVIGGMLRRFCPNGLGDIRIGIAGKFDDDRRAEDLCAIPDLVGGAIAESLTSIREIIPQFAHLTTTVPRHQSTKTDLILGWLSSLNGPLKYLLCAVTSAGEDQRRYSLANLTVRPATGVDSRLWFPPDKGWRRSVESW